MRMRKERKNESSHLSTGTQRRIRREWEGWWAKAKVADRPGCCGGGRCRDESRSEKEGGSKASRKEVHSTLEGTGGGGEG